MLSVGCSTKPPDISDADHQCGAMAENNVSLQQENAAASTASFRHNFFSDNGCFSGASRGLNYETCDTFQQQSQQHQQLQQQQMLNNSNSLSASVSKLDQFDQQSTASLMLKRMQQRNYIAEGIMTDASNACLAETHVSTVAMAKLSNGITTVTTPIAAAKIHNSSSLKVQQLAGDGVRFEGSLVYDADENVLVIDSEEAGQVDVKKESKMNDCVEFSPFTDNCDTTDDRKQMSNGPLETSHQSSNSAISRHANLWSRRFHCVHIYRPETFLDENEQILVLSSFSFHSQTAAAAAAIARCYLCHLSYDSASSLFDHARQHHFISISKNIQEIVQSKHMHLILHNPGSIVTLSCLSSANEDPEITSQRKTESSDNATKSHQSTNDVIGIKKDPDCVDCMQPKTTSTPRDTIFLKDSDDLNREESGIDRSLDTSWSSEANSELFFKGDVAKERQSPSESESSAPLSESSRSWHAELPAVTDNNNLDDERSLVTSLGADDYNVSIKNECSSGGMETSANVALQSDYAGKCPDDVLSMLRPLGFIGQPASALHSRNSCKTLKCPKCNWHYKYQETLEIHMKEKHPESDARCVYCLTGRPHPRLARGEVYTCGYKPYRCEVCNYSTTTKGNLSIHMQSDKHLNNVHDMQTGHPSSNNGSSSVASGSLGNFTTPASSSNSGMTSMGANSEMKSSPPQAQQPPQQLPVSPIMENAHVSATTPSSAVNEHKMSKPKPVWRCEVCNYETTVARNLRIHMTSEKHTHNMLMVQQQNSKHLSSAAANCGFSLGQMALLASSEMLTSAGAASRMRMPAFDPASLYLTPPLTGAMESSATDNEMSTSAMMSVASFDGRHGNQSENGRMYSCVVCDVYSTDLLDDLHQHVQLDRSKESGNSVTMFGNTYVCNLCQYKTNLKANFQLHCKTDKHLQRLQYMNHVREGGPANELRHQYVNVNQPVMQVNMTTLCFQYNLMLAIQSLINRIVQLSWAANNFDKILIVI